MSELREAIIGIYAGSFDPITRGHIGIICESINKLDKLIIAIGKNPNKTNFFTNEEREKLIKSAIEDFKNEVTNNPEATPSEKRAVSRINNGQCTLEIESYDDLTIDLAIKHNAHQLIRGLRPVGDFESEQSLSDANRRLSIARDFDISTTFIPTPDPRYIFASSSIIRALAKEPKAISAYLYPSTAEAVANKVSIQTRINGRNL